MLVTTSFSGWEIESPSFSPSPTQDQNSCLAKISAITSLLFRQENCPITSLFYENSCNQLVCVCLGSCDNHLLQLLHLRSLPSGNHASDRAKDRVVPPSYNGHNSCGIGQCSCEYFYRTGGCPLVFKKKIFHYLEFFTDSFRPRLLS